MQPHIVLVHGIVACFKDLEDHNPAYATLLWKSLALHITHVRDVYARSGDAELRQVVDESQGYFAELAMYNGQYRAAYESMTPQQRQSGQTAARLYHAMFDAFDAQPEQPPETS